MTTANTNTTKSTNSWWRRCCCCCCQLPTTMGGILTMWFFILGLMGFAASLAYNYYVLLQNEEYATGPAPYWILVGGVTSTTASFRIRIHPNPQEEDGGNNDDAGDDDTMIPKLYISKQDPSGKEGSETIVIEQDIELTSSITTPATTTAAGTYITNVVNSQNEQIMKEYGLYAIEITELQPQTKYYYWMEEYHSATTTTNNNSTTTASSSNNNHNKLQNLRGTFRTSSPDGTRMNFRIAAVADAWTGSRSQIFDTIQQDHHADDELQMIVHLGDLHYEDLRTTDVVRRLDAIGTVLNSPSQASLYRSRSLVYVWDDHDYLGNQEPGGGEYDQEIKNVASRSYQMAVPHYPLPAAAARTTATSSQTTTTTTTTTNFTNVPIYQAFTVGTVRFIISDLVSDHTANNTGIYSTQQKEWLYNELSQASRYDFMVWVTSKPWIGTQTSSNKDVYGSWIQEQYQPERSELSQYISTIIGGGGGDDENGDNSGPQNLLVISGDAHMVTFDDGTNTYYGTRNNSSNSINNNETTMSSVRSFPILQTSPLDRMGSTKGTGPYTESCYGYELERTHQYSTISFDFTTTSENNNETTTTAGDGTNSSSACIEIDTYRVDQWSGKETLFSKRLCGKIFQPAVVGTSDGNSEDNNDIIGTSSSSSTTTTACTIEVLSPITIGFFAVNAVLAALLGCMTCIVVSRDTTQTMFQQFSSGSIATLMAWTMATLTAAAGTFVPLAYDNITQYDLRTSSGISIIVLLVMMFVLFVLTCCCFRRNRKRQTSSSSSSSQQQRSSQQQSQLRQKEREFSQPSVVVDPEAGMATGAGSVTDDVKQSQFVIPSVVRSEASLTPSESELPQGVVLTGGEKLHQTGLRGKGIKVAVIDSGVDQSHPGFNGQVKKQVWYREGTPLERDDHGTHVAGTIHLMAPEAEIYDYRVFGRTGALPVDQAIAKAIRQATADGCKVINMSLGGPFPNGAIQEAVQYANSKKVVLVCAAGNEGDNNPLTNEISYPASYKECLSVAAVSKAQGLPVAVFSNSNPMVDYAGIGVDVTSFKPGGGYQDMSGTSMASPHVAGLVACLLSKKSNKPSKIRQILDGLAIDIEAVGVDNATGIGFTTYLSEDEFDEILPRSARPVDIEEDVVSANIEMSY